MPPGSVVSSNPSLSTATSLLICFIPASWEDRAVLADDVMPHFLFSGPDLGGPVDWSLVL